ncbi:Hypothetical protein, putative [Bodo saltans]|uniref:SMP-LTD domain-containing protein n=1 Tax=Bodo saltans TaxID=75058 RepID=A0A0S4JA93_BODSA|nr:Hypothetical protein, putative [Bodo saltans]|eukprot:CUG86909.1 Hypothetical protein, putative [Bodo saltans]
MVGTTVTVYETLATGTGLGGDDPNNNGMSSSARSVVTAEKYVGKISTSQITHRPLSLEEVVYLFADPVALAATNTRTAAAAAAAAVSDGWNSTSSGQSIRTPSSSTSTGGGGKHDTFGKHGVSAVLSAAMNLHKQLNAGTPHSPSSSVNSTGSNGSGGGAGSSSDSAFSSINEKNAARWLKERVKDRLIFLEFIGHQNTTEASPTSQSSPNLSSSWRSIFLQQNVTNPLSTPSGRQPGGGSSGGALSAAAQRATCMVFYFPTRREMDRWANVLAATNHTYDWKQYVRTLPSLDVLNLLAARIFFENTSGRDFEHFVRGKIEAKLNVLELPSPLSGHIEVADITIGGEVPLISGVSFASFSTNGEIGFDFDLHYRGGFRVVFAASFYVKSIRVPQLLFHVHVVEISGRMHVSIGPPPTNKFWIGFHSPPNVRLEFTQEVASHEGVLSSILSWIPDLSETISNFVKVEMFEDMLLPNLDDYALPHIEADSAVKGNNTGTEFNAAAAVSQDADHKQNTTTSTANTKNVTTKKSKDDDLSFTRGAASTPIPVQRSALHARVVSSSQHASGIDPLLSSTTSRSGAAAVPPPSIVSPASSDADSSFHLFSTGFMKSERPPSGTSPSKQQNNDTSVANSLLGVPSASTLRNRKAMEDLRSALKNKAGDVLRTRDSSGGSVSPGASTSSSGAATSSGAAYSQPQWNHPSF